LRTDDFVFLVVAYNIEKADKTFLQRIDTLAQYALSIPNVRFYAVTASPMGTINRVTADLKLGYTFLNADETMLKTMIRSNPGILLMHKGTILKKWHYSQFKWNYNDEDVLKQVALEQRREKEKLKTLTFGLVLALLLVLNALVFCWSKCK
jgi:hypothetical protein